MNIIILGAPGAGKGTQAERISERCHLPHISTGDILRKAAVERSPLGQKAKMFMDKGELVPDEVVIDIIKERLSDRDCSKGFILDGFPRTVAQANALEEMLSKLGKEINAAVDVEVGDEELLRRLTRRRTCSNCGRNYHLDFDPPRREGICDVCGEKIFQREDDKEETVRRRLEVYKEQTAPLIEYYNKEGLLRTVDGKRSIEEVSAQIRNVLEVPCE